jgi:hypothetical protein
MTVPGATTKNAAEPTTVELGKSLSPEAAFESPESGDATSHD